MPIRTSFLALALPLLATVAIAGCGNSSSSSGTASKSSTATTPVSNGLASKSADAIVAATKIAADHAASAHVSGTIVNGTTKLTLDLNLSAGKGGRGHISENGIGFDLIVIGKTAYINGSPAFYSHVAGASAAQLFKGKWLKASASDSNFAALASLADLRSLVDATLTGHKKLAKGATTTINGQQAIAVKDTAKGGLLYVATTGKAYPLEITKDGTNGGKVTFDKWDEPVSVSAPAGAIDIAELKAHH